MRWAGDRTALLWLAERAFVPCCMGDEVDLRGTNVSCPDVALLEAKLVEVISDCP